MKLAVIAGDGIGIEVIAQALRVLNAVHPGRRDDRVRPRGGPLAPHRRGAARLGADRDQGPRRDPARRRRRSVRPVRGARAWPAAAAAVRARPPRQPAPGQALPRGDEPLAGDPSIDFVVIREGTEGPYTGNGGVLRKGTPHEVATEVSVNTAFGAERVIRDAFAAGAAAAQARHPGAQEQRAGVRRRSLDAHVRGRRRRIPRRARRPTTTSTRRRSTWSPIPAATT